METGYHCLLLRSHSPFATSQTEQGVSLGCLGQGRVHLSLSPVSHYGLALGGVARIPSTPGRGAFKTTVLRA